MGKSLGDILVHLDGGGRDHVRIGLALDLAQRFGGRVTGLFARVERFGPGLVARRGSDAFEAAAKASELQFADLSRDAGVPARWWRLAHGEPGHVVAETVVCARLSDLVVLGQHHQGKDAPGELAETVLLQAGRPCLIVPSVGEFPTLGTNVLVAWNGGREAARALHDALPLMETAEAVEFLTVRPPERASADTVPPASLLDHLSQHGVKAVRETLVAENIGVMDMLLSRACDVGADLLVMGGHGGYHLPFSRGAGTQFILRHMTLPILMSH